MTQDQIEKERAAFDSWVAIERPSLLRNTVALGDEQVIIHVNAIAFDAFKGGRASLASQPAAGWMPIESAPKDGRVMLVGNFNSLGKWRTMRGQWISAFEDEDADQPDGVNAGWHEVAVEVETPPNCWPIAPTHWMPLPSPPAGEQTAMKERQ